MLTVDTLVGGNRERDLRTGFTTPPKLTLQSLLSFAMRPEWVFNYFTHKKFELSNVAKKTDKGTNIAKSVVEYINEQYDPAMNWKDAEYCVKKWNKPFALKGVMSVEDAKAAQAKLIEALKSLKKEIRTEVTVENGGSITGTVKCKRVKHPDNVVVYIEEVNGNDYPAPEEKGILDQLNLTFVPHVIAVQKGTKIDFPNSDSVRHNLYSPPDCCNQFNLGTYDVGVIKTVDFDKVCSIPLLCNVHAEMSAFVLVLENPYFSVTEKDGVFKIDNVPPGTYKVSAWHEKLRTVTADVTVEAGKTSNADFNLKKKK